MNLYLPTVLMDIYLKQIRNSENKKKIGNSTYIYQKKQDKACFQHDMAYSDFKDLPKIKVSDKVLCDIVFDIAKYPKHDEH